MASLDKLKGKIAQATNSLRSSSGLFNQKMFYYDEVFPNGKSPWSIQPIDLINENIEYIEEKRKRTRKFFIVKS